MAEETGFYEREIDRTPYAALWGVAGTVAACCVIGAILLFQAGTLIRHTHLSLPHVGVPNPSSAVQSAKDGVDNSVKQATNKAAEAAATAAKQAADQKLNQFLSQ